MTKKQQTINTYNTSYIGLAKKFDTIGARVTDILKAFQLLNKKNANILEIGCGNGRDAEEIIKHTKNYLGLDVSKNLLDIAKKRVPSAEFILADIEEYEFPQNLDIIFAFASLIHIPKDNLKKIFKKIYFSLNENGIVVLSMKHNNTYKEFTKTDQFGTRTYYLYSKKDFTKLFNNFTIIKNEINNFQNQEWLEIILQKK